MRFHVGLLLRHRAHNLYHKCSGSAGVACMFHGDSVHRKCLINCSLNQKKVPLTHIGLHSSHFWTRGEPYTKLQTKHAKL
jgi:hypothetical protein